MQEIAVGRTLAKKIEIDVIKEGAWWIVAQE
jgi:hypothetical protein